MSKETIIEELKIAYAMELETIQSYIAASVNLDGVLSKVVKDELKKDIPEELEHAQKLAERIKILGGTVPGSFDLERNQRFLQPTEDSTDVISIIKGVIDAEEAGIEQYGRIIEKCEGVDYVTQDLVIEILGEEEHHRREFAGFLKEYERFQAAAG
ncbi:MAG TPA: ferritin-like domain-containing protein [Opitutales bacterium]|nr:ferritin-like domain-containing protein [Opitutales bacterium]